MKLLQKQNLLLGSSIIQLSFWAWLPMLSCWVQNLFSFGGGKSDNSFVVFYPS